ncbi:hypothetical protein [Chondromyces apiculatus]|uniref:Lipoprotein n=1 Tax=Chondromyces apiculatus DSM 436 TaxID=1192034 RepID=A0A017T691_9BACT|nr:hypothetical protein [Chondromyces apiculatus]EYF04783.1 Hypothetical protein CAP_4259 [Chondromyces apiculatus DSM 436]
MSVPPRLLFAFGAVMLVACSKGGGGDNATGASAPEGEHQPLVSFEGYVYVDAGATDYVISERVRQQILSVFPALRKSHVLVSKREVAGVKGDAFEREPVVAVDTALDARRPAVRVRYRYLTRADVSRSVEGREEVELAVLHRTRGPDARRIVRECTVLDPEDRRSESAINLDFNATIPGCKAAIQAEQAAIDAARAKLAPAPEGRGEQIPVEELTRLYLPVRVVLESPTAGAPLGVFPRYEPFNPSAAVASPVAIAMARIAPPGAATGEAPPSAAAAGAPSGTPSGAREEWEAPEEHEPLVVEPEQRQALGAAVAERIERAARDEEEGPSEPPPPKEASVSAPPAPRAPGPPRSVRHEETMGERFDSIFEQLFQMKFLAIWISLLAVIPVLVTDRKKKKPTPE